LPDIVADGPTTRGIKIALARGPSNNGAPTNALYSKADKHRNPLLWKSQHSEFKDATSLIAPPHMGKVDQICSPMMTVALKDH
jgi:hypothetical protein